MFKNYYQVRSWVEQYIPFVYGKEQLGLARIENLLALLGNPERKFKSIHIAGTSGKGSTAFYIAKLLQCSKSEILNPKSETNSNFQNLKFKTHFSNFDIRYSNLKPIKIGLHVSPHLIDIRERMQIFRGGKWKMESGKFEENLMPMNRFIRLFNEIGYTVEKIKREKQELTPSYFEILVAASFKYFAEEKVDWAVVEVGLGGRLDATNVLIPAISVITNVGLDHTEILGKTVEKIAWEKAGIIKKKISNFKFKISNFKSRSDGVPVVTAATGKALKVIEKVAKEKGSKVDKINTQKLASELSLQPYSTGPLLAFSALSELGFSFKKEDLKKVFSLKFAGRFEEIDDGVVIDGAHNPDKIGALLNFIGKSEIRKRSFASQNPKSEIILVLAFKKGKKWKKMTDLLMKHLPVKEVIATKFWASTDTGKFAAVEPGEIADYLRIKNYEVRIMVKENSQEAVFYSLNARRYFPNLLTLVTGSLYLVGEVRTMWKLPEF